MLTFFKLNTHLSTPPSSFLFPSPQIPKILLPRNSKTASYFNASTFQPFNVLTFLTFSFRPKTLI